MDCSCNKQFRFPRFASREGPSNKTISSLRPESEEIAFKVIPQYCTAHHVLEIKIYVIRRISARAFQEHGIFFQSMDQVKKHDGLQLLN